MSHPDGEPDTADGDRDPLTTDDGLAEVGDQMPEVEDRADAPGEDTGEPAGRPLLDVPDLDVTPTGEDPLAELAHADDDLEAA